VILWPSQKTRRIWLQGGSICAHCGCETDYAGHKVTGTPPTYRRLVVSACFLLAFAIVGGILIAVVATPRPVSVQAPMLGKQAPTIGK
jgi:hypothetical protein